VSYKLNEYDFEIVWNAVDIVEWKPVKPTASTRILEQAMGIECPCELGKL
jgi:hypothetical protein